MTATIATLVRVFAYAGMELPDPGLHLTPIAVRDLYSASYPELASAEVSGPEMKDDKLVWSFRRAVGTKGSGLHLPRFQLRERDGLSYVEPLPSGTVTWTDRVRSVLATLGEKVDAVLYSTDINPSGRESL